MSLRRPAVVSVVVPVRDDARSLALALDALDASDLPRDQWELIVVDDASDDDSVTVAARHADTVVRLPDQPRGPAYARNRGIEVATGEFVAFVDSDVCVRPDTLRLLLEAFRAEPGLAVVSCAYDEGDDAGGIVTRYRDLLFHFLQQQVDGREIISTSCAMARRAVLLQAGMFDEWRFPRPQIEDLELGDRMRALGYHLRLRRDLQVRHHKRWRFVPALVADVRDRAVPYMRVLGRVDAAARPRFSTATPARTAVLLLLCAALVAGAATQDVRWLWASAALLGVALLANARLLALFARTRGPAFALAAAPLHLAFEFANGVAMGAGWLVYHLVGDPRPHPTLEAFAEVGVRTWPPVPSRPAPEVPSGR